MRGGEAALAIPLEQGQMGRLALRDGKWRMKDKVAVFSGGIPFCYDRELGLVLFANFVSDLARPVAAP